MTGFWIALMVLPFFLIYKAYKSWQETVDNAHPLISIFIIFTTFISLYILVVYLLN